MDPNVMKFEEILFNGRYHIFGGLLFLVFMVAFVREVIRELVTERTRHVLRIRKVVGGPIFHDPLLGHTMADGGEAMEEKGQDESGKAK